jgi:hypothetical protein
MLDWHRFLPVLGTWEQFQYAYTFGAADMHLSFAVAPRANTGGQGYPLVDIGYFLTNALGLSLPGFRLTTQIYGLLAAGMMLLVFSRWFGWLPALLGVTMAVLSQGYLIYSNQVLVMVPSLLLCVLLVEATQQLDRKPRSWGPIVCAGVIAALLLMHYAMGRYFAAGWLAWYFMARLVLAAVAAPSRRSFMAFARPQIAAAVWIGIIAVAGLVLFNLKNAAYLINPMELFFPNSGDEIEMRSNQLISTVVGNLPELGEMLFPYIFDQKGLLPEIMQDARRAPFFDIWHGPFLVIGFLVALRRSFRRTVTATLPYAALHVIAFLSLALPLFSEDLPGSSALISSRIVGGTFAVAGYITVAALWLSEIVQPCRLRIMGLAVWAAVILFAASSLSQTKHAMQTRAHDRARIVAETGAFISAPKELPPYIQEFDYLQARLRALADMLASGLNCRPHGGPVIFQVKPAVVFTSDTDWINPYMHDRNDLSSTLALYLADAGVNAGHTILHGKFDPGYRETGQGYAGPKRVYSGPVSWLNREMAYKVLPPVEAEVKTASGMQSNLAVTTFTASETRATQKALRDAGFSGIELLHIPTLTAAQTFQRTRCAE